MGKDHEYKIQQSNKVVKKAITIQDVARYAGVARSTVSHVMNGSAPISQETKERVLKAIKELGYKPNALARGLRKNQTKMIGLIVPDISTEFYANIAKGVIDVAYEHDYTVVLCGTQYDLSREKMEVNTLIERRIDGMIFAGGGGDDQYILNLTQVGIPIVLADRGIMRSTIPSVETDNITAIKKIVGYLVGRGHKRIGFVSEPLVMTNLSQRFIGFELALEENNINQELAHIYIDKRLQLDKLRQAYEFMKEIFETKPLNSLPTAFVTTSDLIAIGIINAVKSRGLKVPDDIAVCGFDDISIASSIDPPLTTIFQDNISMGRISAELMMENIENPRGITKRVLLDPKLVIRKSA